MFWFIHLPKKQKIPGGDINPFGVVSGKASGVRKNKKHVELPAVVTAVNKGVADSSLCIM